MSRISALKEKSMDIMHALKKKKKLTKSKSSTSFLVSSSSVKITVGNRVDLSMEEEIELMSKAEMEQRTLDRFWGLDKQERDINMERNAMYVEEERSIALENYCKRIEIVAVWEENDRQSRYEDAYAVAVEEAYERKLYLDRFNSVTNSVQVMNYKWPTKPHVSPKTHRSPAKNGTDAFVIEEHGGAKSTIHYEGLQKTRILAQSMSFRKDKEKNAVHNDSKLNKTHSSGSVQSKHVLRQNSQDGVFMKDDKYSLVPLVSRVQSPVMQSAIDASPGMFERPASPLSLLVPETETEAKKKVYIPGVTKTTESTSTNPHDTMAAVALFQNKHLKQLGSKYALEESGPGSVDNNSSDPVSTHIDAYHGHPVHKWDQRVLIKRIFHVVDHTHNNGVHQHKKGTITLQQFLECISLITTHNGSYCNCTEIAVERGTSRAFSRSVSRSTARNKLKSRMNMMNATPAPCTENCLSHLLSLLKFTLFGTWLKLKQSHYFELIFDVNGGDNGVALTKKEFLLAAKAAAHEFQVPPCRIRLPDEHKSTCIHEYSMQLVINNQKKNPKDGSGVEDKLLAKYFATLARDHRLSSLSKSAGGLQRVVKVGDIVWSLYGNGVTWFPAIATSKNDADGTFDLSYPLNTDEFHQMGMELASKEIIDNYKKNNQTFINKTSKKNNIDSSANSNADVVVIPPKCLTDDVAYYKYVFHLIDTVGHDVLDSQLLIDQLRSTAFSDIIKSSLALQMLLSDDGVGNCLFVDLLTCNSQTTEVEFVEVCCTLNEIASYQML